MPLITFGDQNDCRHTNIFRLGIGKKLPMTSSPPVSVLRATDFDSALCLKLQEQRENEELIDCVIRIKTEDGPPKTFKAHRNVLASGSRYFNDKFKSEKTVNNLCFNKNTFRTPPRPLPPRSNTSRITQTFTLGCLTF